jgi:hypothetical protein
MRSLACSIVFSEDFGCWGNRGISKTSAVAVEQDLCNQCLMVEFWALQNQ